MTQLGLPRFQYTIRDESTGALFLAYASELSKTHATLAIDGMLKHLKAHGVDWFLRNKLSFAGNGKHFAIARTQPLASRGARMQSIRALSERLDRTTIENKSWDYILDTYDAPGTFFFLDPPYFSDGGPNYKGWSVSDLTRFCARLKTLKGRWVFTYQDCDEVRSFMRGHKIKAVERTKGIENKAKTGRASLYREVIITDR